MGLKFSELGLRSVCNPLWGSDLMAGGSSCALWWRWPQEIGKVGGRQIRVQLIIPWEFLTHVNNRKPPDTIINMS